MEAQVDADAKDNEVIELLDEAINILSRFVVPLYRDEGGRPSQFGSGFFVRSGSSQFLVSAAHVLELGASLFYYIEPNVTAKLSGERRMSRWNGDRERDPVDVGVLKLKDSVPPYPKVNKCAVDVSYLHPRMLPRADKVYSIIGFPATQSKVNRIAMEVSTTVYAYRNRSIPDAEYANFNASPTTHIILPMDLRKGVDSNRQRRTFPKPQGMSGSPIFVLLEEWLAVESRSFPIVAIGTKYRKAKKILIGTDVDIAVAMINEAV